MSDEIRMTLLHHSTNDLIEELLMWRGLAAEHLDRITELEVENTELKERVAMLDVTAVFKSLGEMGYIEQTNKLHARIAELEAEVTKCHELQDSYCARIAELEAVIDQLIEAGEKMFTAVIAAADSYDEGMRVWDKIINDWKEG